MGLIIDLCLDVWIVNWSYQSMITLTLKPSLNMLKGTANVTCRGFKLLPLQIGADRLNPSEHVYQNNLEV